MEMREHVINVLERRSDAVPDSSEISEMCAFWGLKSRVKRGIRLECAPHIANCDATASQGQSKISIHGPTTHRLVELVTCNVCIYGFNSLCVLVRISLILHKRTLTGTF